MVLELARVGVEESERRDVDVAFKARQLMTVVRSTLSQSRYIQWVRALMQSYASLLPDTLAALPPSPRPGLATSRA